MEELREAHEAAERALCAASSEGLALVRANNASGFKGVMRDARKSKSFQARLNRGGKITSRGAGGEKWCQTDAQSVSDGAGWT